MTLLRLDLEDRSEAQFPGEHPFNRLIHLLQREFLAVRLDSMTGAELQHGLDGLGCSGGGSGDAFLVWEKLKHVECQRLWDSANEVQPASCTKGAQVRTPVQADIGRHEDEVESVSLCSKRVVVGGGYDLVGAQRLHFIGLGEIAAEGNHFAAPLVEELDGKMAQAANPDDANRRSRADVEVNDGVEDGGTGAEQWTGGRRVHPLRNECRRGSRDTHGGAKSTVTTIDDTFAILAEVVVPGGAVLAILAERAEPTRSNPIANLELLHRGSNISHNADDFVATDERVLRVSPVVVLHADVAVAQAAVLHIDINLSLRDGIGELVLKWLELRLSLLCCNGLDNDRHLSGIDWLPRSSVETNQKEERRGIELCLFLGATRPEGRMEGNCFKNQN